MHKKAVFFTFFIILISSFCQAQSALRAQRLLEKDKLGRVINILERTVKRNPADPANNFVMAKYYIHPEFGFEAVDSAHIHIELAAAGFELIESKDRRKYQRKGMDSLQIQQLSLKIDSLAFEKAVISHTESSYNHFIAEFPGAIQLDEAVLLRNELAYQHALAKKTPEAMQDFFRMYPEATQAKKARDAFETMYYEQFTKSKTTESLRNYLLERPGSVYADDAALELLKIQSTLANAGTYREFKEKYPYTQAAGIAAQLLNSITDNALQKELMVHYKNERYYFFDIAQQEILAFQLPEVLTDSCRWIKDVLIRSPQENGNTWYLKNGDIFIEEPLNEVNYLGSGFFKVNYKDQYKQKLIHISKNEQLVQQGLDFKIIDEFLLAKKENNGWQLISLLGEEILNEPVDSIWKTKEVYLFQKEEKIALAKLSDFEKNSRSDLKNFAFLYTDYEVFDDGSIWLESNDFESVANADLTPVIPLQKGQIEKIHNGWTILKDGTYEVLGADFAPLYDINFEQIRANNNVLALKQANKWALTGRDKMPFPEFKYDSVRLFNSWLSFASTDESKELIFHKGKKLKLEEGENFKILTAYNDANVENKDEVRFVDVINKKNYHKLYNGFGQLIYQSADIDATALNESLLKVTKGNKIILLDSAGVKLIENVDGIGNPENGLIPLLKNKKFGALNLSDKKLIPFNSTAKLQVFMKDSLFIYRNEGSYGIMDVKGKAVLKSNFTSVEPLNDSVAFVKEEGMLNIINIYTSEAIVNDIGDTEKVSFKGNDYYVVRIAPGYGLINSGAETIIPFIFNSLEPYITKDQIIWLAERSISEMDYQVIGYYDESGSLLFRDGFTNEEYLKTVCD